MRIYLLCIYFLFIYFSLSLSLCHFQMINLLLLCKSKNTIIDICWMYDKSIVSGIERLVFRIEKERRFSLC